eukprot:TRINITY_DN1546_c0_g1_i1.p1 TRINITY_DN1546_c0_g1~~TRINITY_DN1546_c0_g1_i1.p1  ORF type:complete len:865 (+),score=408.71 TRINITY_DN1546_c0_g1_i1:71-2665(+)
MSVFGVDIGNLNAVVSVARRGGIDVIANEISKRETESFVSFEPTENGERFIGAKGADQKLRNWRNTATHLKRLLGLKYDSPQFEREKQHCLFRLGCGDDGLTTVTVTYGGEDRTFRPEQLIAMLLQKLAGYASREAREEVKGATSAQVKDCVVACPAYYSVFQRKLLFNATQIAGLNCLGIITEQTAACLDWGIYKSATLPDKVADAQLVYLVDLGHSATVITCCKFWQGNLQVLGHVYDQNLGCRDIDQMLVHHFRQAIKEKYRGMDVFENKKARLRLLDGCAKLRTMLSANPTAALNVESIMDDVDVAFPKYTRDELETLIEPILKQMAELVQKAKAMPGVDQEKVVAVELIGGGSRIPKLKAMVQEAFGKQLSTTLNASESIAKGCGVIGAIISPKFKVRDFVINDSNQHNIQLGYHSALSDAASPCSFIEGINKEIPLFRASDPFPKVFDLTFDRSENFDLHVYYKEPCQEVLDTAGTLHLGHWTFCDLPPFKNEKGEVEKDKPVSVVIRFRLNNSGLVAVESASVTETYEVEEEKWVEKKIEEKPEEKKEGEEEKKEGDEKKDEKKDEKPKTEKVKEIVKKKRTRKHEVNVLPHIHIGLPVDVVEKLSAEEVAMHKKDTLIQETLDAKNLLESYSYDYREKVSEGGILFAYMEPEVRGAFKDSLSKVEDWLYSDGEYETKEVYVAKLKELRKPGDAAAARLEHREGMPHVAKQADEDILKVLDEANTLLDTHKGETPTHIPAEKLEEVVKKCEEARKVIKEEKQKVLDAPKHVDMPFGESDVRAKARECKDFARPIFATPKPQPPKEEKKEEKTNGDGAAKEGAQPGSPKKDAEKAPSPRGEDAKASKEEKEKAGMDVD